jgi:hypothetical protein
MPLSSDASVVHPHLVVWRSASGGIARWLGVDDRWSRSRRDAVAFVNRQAAAQAAERMYGRAATRATALLIDIVKCWRPPG